MKELARIQEKRRQSGSAGLGKFRDPIEWENSLKGLRPSSPAWRCVIRAFYGSPLTSEELDLFLILSGGREPPKGGIREIEVVAGRRGGKSETIARVALFEALHGGHERFLAPGQVGLIPVISALREQSAEIIRYAEGLARRSEFAPRIIGQTQKTLRLDTRIEIRVMSADAIAVSGGTAVCVIRDEWAKWPGEEAAMSDADIEDSLRPAMAPVVGAPIRRMIGITSAYVESGMAYKTEQECFGKSDAQTLVVRGSTATFNPSIDRAFLEAERRKNPRIFLREYGDEESGPVWQPAVTESWFGLAAIDKSIQKGVESRKPLRDPRYTIAIDQAFKSDRFACSVVHSEEELNKPTRYVQDRIVAWQAESSDEPLSSHAMARNVAAICREFGQMTVYADQHAFTPLREVFADYGIDLIERPWLATGRKDEDSKSDKFKKVRDGMANGTVLLLDDNAQTKEFQRIKGRLQQSGGESIQAGAGKDDRVFATVLAIHEAMAGGEVGVFDVGW